MSHFKNLPHFFGTLTLWNTKKLIHVERWSEDILCIAIILGSPPLFLILLSPWLIYLHIINNMLRSIWSIYDCIPYPLIYWLNKDFHPNFPKLVINATKHRGLWIEAPSPKGNLFSAISSRLHSKGRLPSITMVYECFQHTQSPWISSNLLSFIQVGFIPKVMASR